MSDEREDPNPGECELCGKEAPERCNDGTCRACHKSIGWEECLDGSWNDRQRAAAGMPPQYGYVRRPRG